MTTGRPGGRGFAWVNGAIVPRAEASLPIDDFAVRYGAAAFETMLARDRRVFRLARHLDRLEDGLRLMGVQPPSRESVSRAIDSTLEANALRDAGVRLTVTAGSGGGPDLAGASSPAVLVTVDPLPPPAPPARLVVSSVRVDEERPWRAAKMSQFLPYLLARREAREQGMDDALLLNRRGLIAEAATANVFLLMDQALVTPSLECGPVPGITREAVLEVARAEGIPVAEAEVTLEALIGASGAFLTSSLGLRVVSEIIAAADVAGVGVDWAASAPDHPVLARVQRAYAALVHHECAGAG